MVHSPVCRCYCFPFYPALNCATSDYPFPEPPSTVSTQQLLPCVTYEEVFQAAAFRLNFPLSPVGSFSRSFFFIIGACKRNTGERDTHRISWNLKYPLVWQLISLSDFLLLVDICLQKKASKASVLRNALRLFALVLLSSLKNYVNAFPIPLREINDGRTGKAIEMRNRLNKKQRGRKTILMTFCCICALAIYLST